MNRIEALSRIRNKLKSGHSIGSWMQIGHASVAEILGSLGYDWVAVDLEHGSISNHQLPDLFRALELGGTLPLARVAEGTAKECKTALDAGAAGIILPMIESADQLRFCIDLCRWPPAGKRGVGFSRANLYGKNFDSYSHEAQAPLIVAQIEHIDAVTNLDAILKTEGLDAIMIGPYDLSASMAKTAQFEDPEFKKTLEMIFKKAKSHRIPTGIHVVEASPEQLNQRINQGFQFIAYSIDAVFLRRGASLEENR